MNAWAKIKALQVEKKKSFRLLIAVEIILILLGIAGLFGKDAVYEYLPEDMSFLDIQLPAGTYRVQMHYSTDTDMKNQLQVMAGDIGEENLRINSVALFSGWNSTDEEMWLLRDTEQLYVGAYYTGEGSLEIQGLTIRQTNAMNRICLFSMLCLFTLVNGIYLYIQYDKVYAITVENKTVTFLLGLTILFAGIPVMLDYVWGGADLGYHLMRVEGIADSLREGCFPNRIAPDWQQGYGYASAIFYGETLLYIAAVFRLIGFSVVSSYRLFLLIVTVATVAVSYICFKKIFKNSYVGVLCSALYSLALYRSYVSYGRTAVGECLALIILPIIVYGFYRVFTQDIQEESYKRSWLPLTIGFSLLIQTHLLTGELAGFFTILLCIILWKKVFRPRTFIVLAKTVIYSILLSAWFLVPFLDYMLTGDYTIHHVSGRTIQSRGGFPAHLLFTFYEAGGTIYFEQDGMVNSSPVGIGIVLIVCLALFGYLLFTRKANQLERQERMAGIITAGFGILAMMMSMLCFPWDKIHSLGSVAQTLVSSIQFPSRLLTIANICLTVVAGVVAKYILKTQARARTACFMAGMVCCLAMGNVYLLEQIADEQRPLRVYNERGMGTGYISGAEYLPYGADASLFMPHDPEGTEGIVVSEYEKRALGACAYIENHSESEEKVAFALLYYKGYRAYNMDTGENLNCYAGDNFEVTVEIPAGFEGMVEVGFESPWYWRVGEAVTLVSVLAMVVYFARKNRRIKKAMERSERII